MIALILIALIAYSTAKFYSPSLVYFVVEQTLLQKAPPETDPALLRKRLETLISAAPNQEAKTKELFRISAYLEKIQQLNPQQMNELFGSLGASHLADF